MANEISASGSLAGSKLGLVVPADSYAETNDMSGTHVHRTVQDVGTTYEAIVIPAEVATPGYARFKNLDTTNYVELGLEVSAAFYAFIKIPPGKSSGPILLAMGRTALFARANTAAVKLDLTIYEA